jgi:Uma2 family endonuclease
MGRMIANVKKQELIEAPLSREELAVRYRDLCEDPVFANVPGKIELDLWGRVLMSPPSVYHGTVQARLAHRLAALGGEPIVEVPVATPMGLFLPDVAWASAQFMALHRGENPLMTAPEICIEVVSPSNSVKELQEKKEAYLAAGAHEVWIVYPQSKRCEFHGGQGLLESSSFAVDLSGLFA